MPVYGLNLRTDEELQTMLSDIQKGMDDLAPYNGTAPGAAAISRLWNERDAIKHEIELRKAGI